MEKPWRNCGSTTQIRLPSSNLRGLIKTYKMNSKALLFFCCCWSAEILGSLNFFNLGLQCKPHTNLTNLMYMSSNVYVQVTTSCLQEGFRILATLPLYGKNYSNSKSAKQNPSCIITMVIITAVTTESSCEPQKSRNNWFTALAEPFSSPVSYALP